ncbi:MAG: hypothetical protein ABFS08_04185 [Pseudomonadota bacterium]
MPQLFLTLLLSLFSAGAVALDITLLYGSQGGGLLNHIDSDSTLELEESPGRALILGIPYSADQDLELFYSRQQTRLQGDTMVVPSEDLFDLDIHYLHLGGTVLSEEYHKLQGFISGGLGLSHFSPALDGVAAENRLSMSLGLGARWMPTKRVGLRVETRFYGTLFNSNTTIFCSGGCQFTISGDLLSQYALFAGLVLRLD